MMWARALFCAERENAPEENRSVVVLRGVNSGLSFQKRARFAIAIRAFCFCGGNKIVG
jgi:hypothetical protein